MQLKALRLNSLVIKNHDNHIKEKSNVENIFDSSFI